MISQIQNTLVKTLLVFSACSFLLFTFGTPVLASSGSGACSWHGGVNCNVGSDWDGSVICRDGWRGSSVDFDDVCEVGCPYGYTEEFKSLLLKCLENQIKAGNEFQSQLAIAEKELVVLKQEAERIRRLAYLEVTETPDEWQDLSPEQQRRLRNQRTIDLSNQFENAVQAITTKKDEIQTIRESMNTVKELATNACTLLSSKSYLYCATPVLTFGCPENAYGSNGSCFCESGYEWNVNQTTCTAIKRVPNVVVENTATTQKTVVEELFVNKVALDIPLENDMPDLMIEEEKIMSKEIMMAGENKFDSETFMEPLTPKKESLFKQVFKNIGGFFSRLFSRHK